MGSIAVTGSVAYDTIMLFRGRFADHILAEKTHLINLSFQVDSLERRNGGTAANVCYTLALLGQRPLLCAAVGAADFDEYERSLEAAGVDTSRALRCDDVGTASAFITTDLDDNQITAFYAGAMARASGVNLRGARDVDIVVVGADAPDAMALHVEQAAEIGARLVFAPAQQIPSLDDGTLRAGLEGAWLVVANDYEMEMMRSRTGLTADVLGRDRIVAVTDGARGSRIQAPGESVAVPVAPIDGLVDPTGAGDAYLAALLAGLRGGASLDVAGRMAAVAAAFCVERRGPQGHHFDAPAFRARYTAAFGVELPRTVRLAA
jgi:adenosine kinase